MPFTFSHPAIVLPLKKVKPEWFSLNGLVMGSIAPDLQYFLKMDAASDFGHTLVGVFAIDLPLAFLAAIAFHLWLRNELIRHLPSPLDRKFADTLRFDFRLYLKKAWLVFALSAFIGALSHIFWDFFGRPEGFFYYLSPQFFEQPLQLGPIEIEMNSLIERIGSILGLVLIIWLIFQKKEITPAVESLSTRKKVLYWGSITAGTIIITAIKLWLDQEEDTLGYYIIIFLSGGLYAFAMASALYNLLEPGRAVDGK